jgi:hypothetical protein
MEVCASEAIYSSAEGTTEADGKGLKTISSMTQCEGPVQLKKGDKFKLRAAYDVINHPP